MKLSLSTHLLVYRQLQDPVLAAMAAAGYRTVEVWLAEPHVPWRSTSACEKFRQRLAKHSLRAGSVHLPFYPSVPELINHGSKWSVIDNESTQRQAAIEGAARGLEAAAELGAACAVLHLGWPGDDWSGDRGQLAREAVFQLLPTAKQCGVQLLLENIISDGTRAGELVTLLDEVDPDGSAGICLDLGHANVEGNVLSELSDALPRLAHLHVHDNDGHCDSHHAPGQGSIPWAQVLNQLAQIEFSGMGALELRDFSRGDDELHQMLNRELGLVADFCDKHRHPILK